MEQRLQKILAQQGIASRRNAEVMICTGRVRVNGHIAVLGQKVNLDADTVTVDGAPIQQQTCPPPLYLLLHKPRGYISTCADPQGRPTVLQLLPSKWQSGIGLHPVGRLDAASTGALLLTNDGAFTCALTHPRYHVPKTYQVWVQGQPSPIALQQWRRGVALDGRQTLPARVQLLAQEAEQSCLEITLWEGRNRQIRRIADRLGYPVVSLHRVAIGSIALGTLPSGKHRLLRSSEVECLMSISLKQQAIV